MTEVGGAPPPQSNVASPFTYIGRPISLISKSQIRYEGILFTIDTNESTVALRNVRSFGTEGRNRPEGAVPPVNSVYDYVIFRGADILDLQVLNPMHFAPPQPQPYHDPAIVARSSVAPRPAPQQQDARAAMPPQDARTVFPTSQLPAQQNRAYPVPPLQHVPAPTSAGLGNGVIQGSVALPVKRNGVPPTSVAQVSAAQAAVHLNTKHVAASLALNAGLNAQRTTHDKDVKQAVPTASATQQTRQPLPQTSAPIPPKTSEPEPALRPLQQTSKTGLRPLPPGVAVPTSTSAKPALRPLQQPTGTGAAAQAQPPYKGWGPPPHARKWGPPPGRNNQNGAMGRRAPPANASGNNPAPAPGATRPRGGRGGRRQRRRGPGIEVPSEDFDFESMHNKFDKVSLDKEPEVIPGMPAIAEPYDRSRGFFDQLVPEKEMPRQRPNAAQRRAADMETFGEVGNVHARTNRYRSTRGRRGGRNRARNNTQPQPPTQQAN